MTTFYTHEYADRLLQRCRICRIFCAGLAVLSLAICIFLCCITNTLNEASMRLTVTLIAVFSGWAVMLSEVFIARPAKADGIHMKGILEDPVLIRDAELLSLAPSFRIPGSIELQKLRIRTAEGEETLNVLKRNVSLLPSMGRKVRLATVRTTVTGWEEQL